MIRTVRNTMVRFVSHFTRRTQPVAGDAPQTTPTKRNVLIYTVHKAASRFLTRLTNRVSRRLQMDYHSISIDDNYHAIVGQSWKDFVEKGDRRGCFGPIRFGAAEPSVPADLEKYSIIAHLRDPRDVLTSLYFSHAHSHGPRRFDPGITAKQNWQKQGIDQFVLERASLFRERYEVFCSEFLGRENLIFLKYETLISDYGAWLDQFLQGFADWAAPEQPKRRFWQKKPRLPSLSTLHPTFYETFKDEFTVLEEDVHRHKRQVTPGDHRRKQRPETIDELNSEFSDVLYQLGYATVQASHTSP